MARMTLKFLKDNFDYLVICLCLWLSVIFYICGKVDSAIYFNLTVIIIKILKREGFKR